MNPKTRQIALVMTGLALIMLLSGCLSLFPRKPQVGEIVWEKGKDPQKDAPKWVKDQKAALKEAKVSSRDVPKKKLVYVGVSEDKNNERGARFDAMDDMLKRYAAYLKKQLDEILPDAAKKAKVKLPMVDTAVGAYQAVGYIPKGQIEMEILKAEWIAVGRKSLAEGEEPVYRAHVLGVIDREIRRPHILEAAKETFKHAIIQAEAKDRILEQVEKIVAKL